MKITKISGEINVSDINQYLDSIQKIRGEGLKEHGYYYSGPEDFILQHGIHYTSQKLTNNETDYLKQLCHATKKYKIRQCFYNAQSLSQVSDDKIKYIEGYLFSGVIPIEHAWNTLNGKILDFTMARANNGDPILGIIPDGWNYLGVDIPTETISKYWVEHGQADAIIGNWMENYPLLKEKFEN